MILDFTVGEKAQGVWRTPLRHVNATLGVGQQKLFPTDVRIAVQE
jgi:hypothetical protein